MTEPGDSNAFSTGFPIDIDTGASNCNLSEDDRLKVEAYQELWKSIDRLALLRILERENGTNRLKDGEAMAIVEEYAAAVAEAAKVDKAIRDIFIAKYDTAPHRWYMFVWDYYDQLITKLRDYYDRIRKQQ